MANGALHGKILSTVVNFYKKYFNVMSTFDCKESTCEL